MTMSDQEFAPVTPGEMLKEEFLAEYGLSQNALAKGDRHLAEPDRRDREQPAADHGGYGAAARPVLWQQSGILDEPPDPL
jgi:hypothetical protein